MTKKHSRKMGPGSVFYPRRHRIDGALVVQPGTRALAFAERVLPRASDLWAQASLDQRQRPQQLFFPEGIAFHGKRFVRTGVSSSAFNYLMTIEPSKTNW